MNNLGNKEIFSKNLKKYIELSGKERKEIADALGFSYSTFTDWVNGNVYPRIDRIELIANYFNITKSDLIEDDNDSDAIAKLIKSDDEFIQKILIKYLDLNQEDKDIIKKAYEIIKSNID